MMTNDPPMTDAERQARFRANNPGYNNRYRHRQSPQAVQAAQLNAIAAAQSVPSQTAPPVAAHEAGDFVI